jgi:undecaprenyl-diphosphatase
MYRLSGTQAIVVTLWLIALTAFCVMAGFAFVYTTFPLDLRLTLRIQDIDNAVFAHAVDWAEDLADGRILIAVYVIVAAALWLSQHRFEVLLLALIALARVVNAAAKEIIERARPTAELVLISDQASGFGFPSGHAQGSLLFYGFLAYLAETLIDNRLARRLVQAACLAIIALTWIERVYVGAHWPSDVIGGGLLGLAILIPIVWVHQLYLARSSRKGAKVSLTE